MFEYARVIRRLLDVREFEPCPFIDKSQKLDAVVEVATVVVVVGSALGVIT